MVGAGALVKPLLGFPHWAGVIIVGVVVMLIVVTAGMVCTTWVQFIKGSLLVVFCAVLTVMILNRGLNVPASTASIGPPTWLTESERDVQTVTITPDGKKLDTIGRPSTAAGRSRDAR